MVDWEKVYQSAEYIWVERALSVSLFLVLVLMFAVHLFHVRKLFSRQSSLRRSQFEITRAVRYRQLSHAFVVIMFVLWTLQLAVFSANSWDVARAVIPSCTWLKRLSTFGGNFGKEFMYLTFLMRLEMTFYGTTYRKQIRHLLVVLYVVICGWGLNLLWLDAFIPKGEVTHIRGIGDYCVVHYPNWGVLLFLGLDIFISICACYAFNQPLRRMLKDTDRNERIAVLLTKYAIVTTVAVASSFFAMSMLIITRGAIWVEIDFVVNAMCVTLMFSWNMKMYRRLCCGCIRVLDGYKVANKVVREQAAEMMRRMTERSSGHSSRDAGIRSMELAATDTEENTQTDTGTKTTTAIRPRTPQTPLTPAGDALATGKKMPSLDLVVDVQKEDSGSSNSLGLGSAAKRKRRKVRFEDEKDEEQNTEEKENPFEGILEAEDSNYDTDYNYDSGSDSSADPELSTTF